MGWTCGDLIITIVVSSVSDIRDNSSKSGLLRVEYALYSDVLNSCLHSVILNESKNWSQ